MQPNIDIGEALRRGFELYKENITTLMLATLLATIISFVSVFILAGPMFAGVIMLTLALVDKKQPKPDIGAIFKGFDVFLPSLVFMILLLVATFVGQLILGLFPLIGFFTSTLYGMALSTVVMFGLFYIADKGMDVVAAIQKSYEVVKSNFWIFLGLNIVAQVVSSLGVIACIIGIIVTLPMYYCTIAVVYRDLHPASNAG